MGQLTNNVAVRPVQYSLHIITVATWDENDGYDGYDGYGQ